MTEEKFWELIEKCRSSQTECEEQAEKLTEILVGLPSNEILEFDRIFAEKRNLAYRWDLWGVAYLMNGGCSDDGFEYFRCWLIGQGREAFERALKDPESIADLTDAGDVECEDLLYAATKAYEQVTDGEMMPPHKVVVPDEPAGETWEEDDLTERFPRVSEKFA